MCKVESDTASGYFNYSRLHCGAKLQIPGANFRYLHSDDDIGGFLSL